ncbi:MAG TPA: chain length determinant protein [Streptomyces sp.]
MDLAEIVRVMRRRWYVLLPGLLLTAALVVGAYVTVPITYQSQSTVMLLNSQRATVAFDGNPFLSTQTSLTGMADSLARNLNSDASVADLRAQGATGTPVAKIADNALGPLMWLTVTGTDKAAVLRSDKLLTDYAAKRLDDFQTQQSVTPKAMIRMTVIVPPQNPAAMTKTRTEYLALAAIMGIVVSMAATFYVEARRRPRPAGVRAATDSAQDAASEPSAAPGTAAGKEGPGQGADAEEPEARPAARTPVRPAPRWSARTGDDDADAAADDGAAGRGARDERAAQDGLTGSGTAAGGTPATAESHRFV